MKYFIEKNKVILLVLFLILVFAIIVGIIFLAISNKSNKINHINEKNYSFYYDNTWKTEELEQNEIKLLHKKSNSELNIKINELNDEIQYKSLDEILDNLLYNIEEQNKNYKLLNKEDVNITKNNLKGYKILFENNDNQVEICLYKQGNKVVIFIYEATYEYFDILLDSTNTIINSFSLNEQKFDVTSSIDLKTKQIEYSEQEKIVSMLQEEKQEEICDKNYLVNYSIPSNFDSTYYSSKDANFTFKDLPSGTSIDLRTNIFNINLYEYLDKENTNNIYNNYNFNSNNKANEALDIFEKEPLSYIYKNSYLTNNTITENIEIVFELNENHIFRVIISSSGIGIPEKLVRMIKVNKIENYASNIKIEKEEGFLIGKLKRLLDGKKIEEIKLKIPEKYKEIDNEQNLYEERNYGLNLNQEKQIYEYEVKYRTISFDIESELQVLDTGINKNNGEYKDFSKAEDITVNDKIFKAYERGYTRESNAMDEKGNRYKYYSNEKVLFYDLQNGSYLVLIISANDRNIDNELIKHLANFEIIIK